MTGICSDKNLMSDMGGFKTERPKQQSLVCNKYQPGVECGAPPFHSQSWS